MRLHTAALALALALAPALLAGCIAPQDVPQESETATAPPPDDRIDGMTAEVTKEDKAVPCSGGNSTLELPSACAERDLLATGRIGVDELPVSLDGQNGPITIQIGPGDAWSFHAVYRVRALTPEDAMRALDASWNWTHEADGQHVLRAGPAHGDMFPVSGLATGIVMARYEVVLPAWVVLDLEARTSNGPITVEDFAATKVDLATSNGPVTFVGSAKDVAIDTSNGPATLTLQPLESGKVRVSTSNGAITIAVVEGTRYGYDVDASTSNGRIVIELQDGEVDDGDEPQAGYSPSSHATFRTRDYENRAVQTVLELDTSNGPITVAG